MKAPKNARLVLLVSGLLSLLLFAGFSKYVKGGGLTLIDFATTVKIQERIDKSSRLRLASFVGDVMEGSTFFASPEVSIVIVLALTVWAGIDWRKKRIRWQAAIIPLTFFFLVLGEIYGKSVVHHPSPPFFMIKNPTSMFPKDYINEQFSYPSGHVARAVFMAIIAFFLFSTIYNLRSMIQIKKTWVVGGLLGAYVALVAISRIYLGHHWLSDILGGGMLGVGMSLLAISIL